MCWQSQGVRHLWLPIESRMQPLHLQSTCLMALNSATRRPVAAASSGTKAYQAGALRHIRARKDYGANGPWRIWGC